MNSFPLMIQKMNHWTRRILHKATNGLEKYDTGGLDGEAFREQWN